MGMTDEKRKELCRYLRRCAEQEYHDAADEIDRLSKKLAEAEAALRNTLLHYKISDVHPVDVDDLAR